MHGEYAQTNKLIVHNEARMEVPHISHRRLCFFALQREKVGALFLKAIFTVGKERCQLGVLLHSES